MAKRKYLKKDLDAVQDDIISLRAKGYNQTQIGQILDMSQQNVSRHLRMIQLKKAIKRDADLEVIRDTQVTSAELAKQKAWETAEKYISPDVTFKALAAVSRADDQINKLNHLYGTPPLLTGEDVLADATTEELEDMMSQIYDEEDELGASDEPDPPIPSQEKAPPSESGQCKPPVSDPHKTNRSHSSVAKTVQKVTARKPRSKSVSTPSMSL